MKMFAIAVAAALSLVPAGRAFADDAESAAGAQGLSTSVSTSDLDLRERGDVEVLYRRLQHAAHSLCARQYQDLWDVKRVSRRRRCYERTLATAIERAHIPALAALHAGEVAPAVSRRQASRGRERAALR